MRFLQAAEALFFKGTSICPVLQARRAAHLFLSSSQAGSSAPIQRSRSPPSSQTTSPLDCSSTSETHSGSTGQSTSLRDCFPISPRSLLFSQRAISV